MSRSLRPTDGVGRLLDAASPDGWANHASWARPSRIPSADVPPERRPCCRPGQPPGAAPRADGPPAMAMTTRSMNHATSEGVDRSWSAASPLPERSRSCRPVPARVRTRRSARGAHPDLVVDLCPRPRRHSPHAGSIPRAARAMPCGSGSEPAPMREAVRCQSRPQAGLADGVQCRKRGTNRQGGQRLCLGSAVPWLGRGGGRRAHQHTSERALLRGAAISLDQDRRFLSVPRHRCHHV